MRTRTLENSHRVNPGDDRSWSVRFLGSLLVLALACAVLYGLVHPVCEPLSPREVRRMDPPFDRRTERDMFYLRVYQRDDDGQPLECRTWLTRQGL